MDSDNPTTTEPAPKATAPAWKRYAKIAVPLVILLVVATYMFWPRIKLGFALTRTLADQDPAAFDAGGRDTSYVFQMQYSF